MLTNLSRAATLAALCGIVSAQNPYGTATRGSGAFEPQLGSTRAFIGNSNFKLTVQCGIGGGPTGVLFGIQPTQLPFLGADILVDPGTLLTTLPATLSPGGAGAGFGVIGLPIPASTSAALIGVPLFAQALILDSGAALGLAASRGLRFEVHVPPLVFVGSSILNNDPFQLIEPTSGVIVDGGAPAQVDNTSGAVFADGGQRLYVSSGIRGTVGVADTQTIPLSFTTIYTSPGSSAYGIAHDPQRDLIWTMSAQSGGTVRELVALDANVASPSYGMPLYQTVGFGSRTTDRWVLSADGRRAARLDFIGHDVSIVDLDPTSPSFMAISPSALRVPTNQGGFSLPTDLAFTPDGRYLLVTVQIQGTTPAELARLDIDAQLWIDHNPSLAGDQNIGPLSQPPAAFGSAPTTIEISHDGSFAIISGFGSCGWVGRLALDPKDPLNFAYVPWSPGVVLANSWTAALSGDETEVGITLWPSNGCTEIMAPELLRLDANTGSLLSRSPIPFNSNSPTLQNLYTVVYR